MIVASASSTLSDSSLFIFLLIPTSHSLLSSLHLHRSVLVVVVLFLLPPLSNVSPVGIESIARDAANNQLLSHSFRSHNRELSPAAHRMFSGL